MSNICKKPINVPDNVIVNINSNKIDVKGDLGELFMEYNKIINI